MNRIDIKRRKSSFAKKKESIKLSNDEIAISIVVLGHLYILVVAFLLKIKVIGD